MKQIKQNNQVNFQCGPDGDFLAGFPLHVNGSCTTKSLHCAENVPLSARQHSPDGTKTQTNQTRQSAPGVKVPRFMAEGVSSPNRPG